jgi:hypothetical protein
MGIALFSLAATTTVTAQQGVRFPAADTVDGLEYRAGVEPTQYGMNIRGFLATPGSYRVFLVAKNVTREPIERLLPAGCMLEPKVYPVAPKPKPRTRNARKRRNEIASCDFDAVELRLMPGEAVEADRWAQPIHPRFTLGDSLPSGEYIVTARIRPAGLGKPPQEIYAGRVMLTRIEPGGSRETGHEAAPGPQRETATAVISRPVQRSELQDYCARRPELAGRDSVVVNPAALTLWVGEVLRLESLSTISFRSGQSVPVHYAVDPPVAKMGAGEVHALAAGTTHLRIRPLCATLEDQGSTAPVTSVPITIRPATTPSPGLILDPTSLLQVYTPVLRHVKTSEDVTGRSLILEAASSNGWCHPHCIDSTRVVRTQPDTVREALQRVGLVEPVSEPRRDRRTVAVMLGIPFRLREGFQVMSPRPGKIEGPPVEWVGTPPDGVGAASVAVDVRLFLGTTEVGGHLSPDLKLYRYFLTPSAEGYAIVARILTAQT